MSEESVAQFASREGVSPRRVRALIERGAVPARRVGGQWLVDQNAVWRPAVSRPLSARIREALVSVLSGDEVVGLVAAERYRLHRYVDVLRRSVDPADMLASWVPQPAPLRMRVAVDDLADLSADARVVATGFSDPRSEIAASGLLEARVARADVEDLRREFLLRPSGDANVLLHVSDGAPPSPVPLGLLLVDLAHHEGVRERSRVELLLRQIIA